MNPKIRHQVLCEWTGIASPMPNQPRTAEQHLAHVIPGLMTRLGLEQLTQQRMIVDAWRELVGEDIARYAQPTRIHRGVLTVSVNNAVWLHELSRYHKQTILQKIAARFNPCPVKDIHFRCG
jgi:predicted nucleic acid-binding Zn ribbon protein